MAHDVATYEGPGPGGWYDDLGHPGRSPHLRRGHGATLLQGLDPENRPSHNRCARSYRGEAGVLLAYTGLEPDAAYQVRLTYVALPTRGGAAGPAPGGQRPGGAPKPGGSGARGAAAHVSRSP